MDKESGENVACNALKPILQGADGTLNFGDDLLCPVFVFCVVRIQTSPEFPLLGQPTAAQCGKHGFFEIRILPVHFLRTELHQHDYKGGDAGIELCNKHINVLGTSNNITLPNVNFASPINELNLADWNVARAHCCNGNL
jgi:hypothetical protein